MAKTSTEPVLLIVTDLVITSVWLKKHLKDHFQIIHEKTEKGAIDRIKNTQIDFIIVDGHMKNLHPLTFLLQLKKSISPKWVPILFITENLKKSFRDRVVKAGATDFLNEPLDEGELFSRIATSLKTSETQKKIKEISEELKQTRQNLPQNILSTKFLLSDKAIRELARAKREKTPLTIAIIRLDSFEEMEARFGTHGMDKLLMIFSNLLIESIAETDILIPSKDGKFILIMPGIDIAKAEKISEELRNKIQKRTFKTSKGTLSLSVSIVLTTYDEKNKLGSEEEFDRMLELAGGAMKKIQKTSQIISISKRSS